MERDARAFRGALALEACAQLALAPGQLANLEDDTIALGLHTLASRQEPRRRGPARRADPPPADLESVLGPLPEPPQLFRDPDPPAETEAQAIVEQFPHGISQESCVGHDCPPSLLTRYERDEVSTAQGPASLVVRSTVWFAWDHPGP